ACCGLSLFIVTKRQKTCIAVGLMCSRSAAARGKRDDAARCEIFWVGFMLDRGQMLADKNVNVGSCSSRASQLIYCAATIPPASIRAGYQTGLGSVVATRERRSARHPGRAVLGRFAHKPTKPEAQFRHLKSRSRSSDRSTLKQRGSAG